LHSPITQKLEHRVLNESVDMERLKKAEIMQELGDFDESLVLLETLSDERLMPAVTVIRNLAEQGDSVVTQIDTYVA
jgi:hypothetical protein